MFALLLYLSTNIAPFPREEVEGKYVHEGMSIRDARDGQTKDLVLLS